MDALRVAQRPSPCDGPLGPFPVGGLRQVHNQRVYDNMSHKIVRISSGLDCPLALTNTSYFLFSMELSQLDTLGANGGYGPDCEVTRDHRNPYILQIQSAIPDIVHNVSYARSELLSALREGREECFGFRCVPVGSVTVTSPYRLTGEIGFYSSVLWSVSNVHSAL